MIENRSTKNDKILRIITLIANIPLWIMLLPSMLFAFTSMFAAGPGFTSDLHKIILLSGIALAVNSPGIILVGAIASLKFRKKKKYILSIIFEIIPFGFIIMSILLFFLSDVIA